MIIEILAFFQAYSYAILIIGGTISGLLLIFGKMVDAESPGYVPDETHHLISGFLLLIRLFTMPAALLTLLAIIGGMPQILGFIEENLMGLAFGVPLSH